MDIVMSDERGNSPLKMSLIEDQQPVETLGGSRRKPLRDTIRLRRTNSRQVIPPRRLIGPTPAFRSHARTVVADTTNPSPFNSPTIR